MALTAKQGNILILLSLGIIVLLCALPHKKQETRSQPSYPVTLTDAGIKDFQ